MLTDSKTCIYVTWKMYYTAKLHTKHTETIRAAMVQQASAIFRG